MFVDTPVQSVINNNRQYNFGMCNSKPNKFIAHRIEYK